MPLRHTINHGHLLLNLRGGLTIFQAAERKPELLHLLGLAEHSVALDLSAVDELDTAGIQLLLLVRREAARRGLPVEVVAYSPAVLASFDLLQLHALFLPASASVEEPT